MQNSLIIDEESALLGTNTEAAPSPATSTSNKSKAVAALIGSLAVASVCSIAYTRPKMMFADFSRDVFSENQGVYLTKPVETLSDAVSLRGLVNSKRGSLLECPPGEAFIGLHPTVTPLDDTDFLFNWAYECSGPKLVDVATVAVDEVSVSVPDDYSFSGLFYRSLSLECPNKNSIITKFQPLFDDGKFILKITCETLDLDYFNCDETVSSTGPLSKSTPTLKDSDKIFAVQCGPASTLSSYTFSNDGDSYSASYKCCKTGGIPGSVAPTEFPTLHPTPVPSVSPSPRPTLAPTMDYRLYLDPQTAIQLSTPSVLTQTLASLDGNGPSCIGSKQALASFVFDPLDQDLAAQWKFTCAINAPPVLVMTDQIVYDKTQPNSDGDLTYLSGHSVVCPTNTYLSSWIPSVKGGLISFSYSCLAYTAGYVANYCYESSTNWNDAGNSLTYLRSHHVQCDPGSALTSLTPSTKHAGNIDEFHFKYTCCKGSISYPTAEPSLAPISSPTEEPISLPTSKPIADPTAQPIASPTTEPIAVPTFKPTPYPTAAADPLICPFTFKQGMSLSVIEGCTLMAADDLGWKKLETSTALYACSTYNVAPIKLGENALKKYGLFAGGKSLLSFLKPGPKSKVDFFADDFTTLMGSFTAQTYKPLIYTTFKHKKDNDDIDSIIITSDVGSIPANCDAIIGSL